MVSNGIKGDWLAIKLPTFKKQLEAYGLRVESSPSGNYYIVWDDTIIEPFAVTHTDEGPVLFEEQALHLLKIVADYRGGELATSITFWFTHVRRHQ